MLCQLLARAHRNVASFPGSGDRSPAPLARMMCVRPRWCNNAASSGSESLVKKLQLLAKNAQPNAIIPRRRGSASPSTSGSWEAISKVSTDRPTEALELFEKVYEHGKKAIPAWVVPLLVSASGKVQKVERLIDVLVSEVESGRLVLQQRHLTQLISSLGSSNQLEPALALYELLEPNEVTFTAMLDVITRYPDEISRAKTLWQNLKQKKAGETFDINLYTTLSELTLSHHKFDWYQEVEQECRSNYHIAVSKNSTALIAKSCYSPKHCIHVSGLLRRNWLPTLPLDHSSDLYASLYSRCRAWEAIRQSKPGNPLTPQEIERWEQDVDFWLANMEQTPPHLDP